MTKALLRKKKEKSVKIIKVLKITTSSTVVSSLAASVLVRSTFSHLCFENKKRTKRRVVDLKAVLQIQLPIFFTDPDHTFNTVLIQSSRSCCRSSLGQLYLISTMSLMLALASYFRNLRGHIYKHFFKSLRFFLTDTSASVTDQDPL
jgi:hypothetical protein